MPFYIRKGLSSCCSACPWITHTVREKKVGLVGSHKESQMQFFKLSAFGPLISFGTPPRIKIAWRLWLSYLHLRLICTGQQLCEMQQKIYEQEKQIQKLSSSLVLEHQWEVVRGPHTNDSHSQDFKTLHIFTQMPWTQSYVHIGPHFRAQFSYTHKYMKYIRMYV